MRCKYGIEKTRVARQSKRNGVLNQKVPDRGVSENRLKNIKRSHVLFFTASFIKYKYTM